MRKIVLAALIFMGLLFIGWNLFASLPAPPSLLTVSSCSNGQVAIYNSTSGKFDSCAGLSPSGVTSDGQGGLTVTGNVSAASVTITTTLLMTPLNSAPSSPVVGDQCKVNILSWDPIAHGVAYTASTLAFTRGSGSTHDTITDSANGFLAHGFTARMNLSITDASGSNTGITTISPTAVTSGVITLPTIGAITAESAGNSVTLFAGFNYSVQYGTSLSWGGLIDDNLTLLVSNVYAIGSVPMDFPLGGWGNQIGGTALPTTMGKICKRTKYPFTLTGYTLEADQSCTATVKLYLDVYSSSTQATDDMTGGNYITTSAALAKRSEDDTNFSNWTTTIPANYQVCMQLTTNDHAESISVTLHGLR